MLDMSQAAATKDDIRTEVDSAPHILDKDIPGLIDQSPIPTRTTFATEKASADTWNLLCLRHLIRTLILQEFKLLPNPSNRERHIFRAQTSHSVYVVPKLHLRRPGAPSPIVSDVL